MNSLRKIHWAFVVLIFAAWFFLPGGIVQAETFDLQSAIDYAVKSNKVLGAKREDVAASEGVRMNAWSYMLPKITLEGGYTRLSEVPVINVEIPNAPIDIPKTKMGDEDNYKAEIKLNQLLFASGQAYSAVQAAKNGELAAREGVLAEQETLSRQVAEAFYAVLFTQEIYAAQKQSLATSESHLKDVENRFKEGVSSKYELLRAEVETANLRPEVAKAANAVVLTKTGLKALMGYDIKKPIEVDGTLQENEIPLDYDQAAIEAIKNRHELAALDFASEAQDHLKWSATAGMLPKVVGFAGYSYQKPWYFETDWTDIWSVGVGISIPVFDGLGALGKRRETAARQRQVEKQKSALADGIDLEIRSALLDLKEIKGRIAQTQANVERANQAYQMAESAYKNGVVTNLEVLDAQLALTGAKTKYIQALYDFQVAKTKLLAASGRLTK